MKTDCLRFKVPYTVTLVGIDGNLYRDTIRFCFCPKCEELRELIEENKKSAGITDDKN